MNQTPNIDRKLYQRALHLCLHSVYEKTRRGFWKLCGYLNTSLTSHAWKIKCCPTCDILVEKYASLSDFHVNELAEHKCPYTLDDFETLNYKAYSCPNCGASDRDRLISSYLQQEISKGKKIKHILDIAPAKALGQQLKQITKSYRSADLYMEDVTDKTDITNMTVYADKTFDLVVCSHVLEHIPDDLAAMREINRVLKSKGIALILVPIVKQLDAITEDIHESDPNERWRKFAQNDHVRLYSQKGLVERLTQSGFRVSKISGQSLLMNHWYDPGFEASSILYKCVKSKR
ncbi:class I SAM-dependent methyltransferase [soil metagenome]